MNSPPSFWQLVRYALKIGFFIGLVSGVGFGLFFGLLFSSGGLLFFIGIVGLALLVGALIGTVFGTVNGLIIAWITQRFFLPPTDRSGFHRTMGWSCMLGSFLLGVAVVGAVRSLAGFGVIAIPILTVIGWWASQKVCDWYIKAGDTPTVIESPY